MTLSLAGLGSNPALYPAALDLPRDAVFLTPMAEADYRRASFLDERMLLAGTPGAWVPLAAIERELGAPTVPATSLHFIFHSGHVGSTLLSRLLDETGIVLPLREPLPLRVLAEAFDHDRPGTGHRLELLLRLWERGFPPNRAVVLKATSSSQRLAPRLLRARPASRAVLLNVGAETYLATMLAGENSAQDLNGLGPERLHRLGRQLGGQAPRPTTLGELAAMSWLAERLTQAAIASAFGSRVLAVDFDRMLESLSGTLGRVFDQFGVPGQAADTIAASEVLSRYSKAPEHAYTPDLRRRSLDEARRLYPGEIGAALDWLAALGRGHDSVAAVL